MLFSGTRPFVSKARCSTISSPIYAGRAASEPPHELNHTLTIYKQSPLSYQHNQKQTNAAKQVWWKREKTQVGQSLRRKKNLTLLLFRCEIVANVLLNRSFTHFLTNAEYQLRVCHAARFLIRVKFPPKFPTTLETTKINNPFPFFTPSGSRRTREPGLGACHPRPSSRPASPSGTPRRTGSDAAGLACS